MTVTLAFVILLSLAQERPAAQPSAITTDDLAVIDAALSHKARNAINLARPRGTVLLLDRTLEPCGDERSDVPCFGYGEKTTAYLQRAMPEITKADIDALLARNVFAQFLPSPPAKDVVLVSKERLSATMKQYDANVHAFTSLPAYLGKDTALIYLYFSCGRLCGQGNFLLLKRGAKGWKVRKAVVTVMS